MSTVAYAVLAAMLTLFVLLDGYDLGVAALEFFVARNERERGQAMASVGPFLHGNEVWLIAAGGALFALFPQAYASSFSGFYLPFMIVLWLLMIRGIALELRGHFRGPLWRSFWDVAFSGSSALLILLFGVAIGNMLRGVPLDVDGYFQGTLAFLLNPYAVEVGLFALLVLALHGATFLRLRVDGAVSARCRAVVTRLWWLVLIMFLQLSFSTVQMRATIAGDLGEMARVIGWLAPVPFVSVAALIAMVVFTSRGRNGAAFGASCVFLAALLVEAAGTMYPYIMPSFPAGQGGISIFAASPSPPALLSALVVTVVGAVAVLIYASFVFRRFGVKLSSESGS